MKKLFTISTLTFNSIADAKKALLSFEEGNGIRPGSQIMEISQIYDIKIKKVVEVKKFKEKLPKFKNLTATEIRASERGYMVKGHDIKHKKGCTVKGAHLVPIDCYIPQRAIMR